MASSNIKLFDENKGNMLSDSEFSISNQRMNGLQTGVASSQLQNKAMYQASLVAYAIAQVMMQNGKNANDTDAVSAFVANLSGTMLQKVYDIATTAEAQAGVATGKWMSPALVKAAIDTLAAKASSVLSLETKQKFYGMTESNTPDDVFRFFGKYNLYYWKRRRATKSIKQTLQNLIYDGYYNTAFYVWYTDAAPTITSDFNDTSLAWGATPTKIGGSATSGGASLLNKNVKGKYWCWRAGNNTGITCSWYSLSNANFTSTTKNENTKINGTNTYNLSVQIDYSAYELVTSLQSNAYPNSGFGDVVQVSGGYQAYEYVALGRPLDKLDITL